MTERKNRRNPEYGPNSETMRQMANWWGGRLIATREQIAGLKFFDQIKPFVRYGAGYYALVTHHCSDNGNKVGIKELGGIIGVPDLFSVAYGSMASEQIRRALGEQCGTYGSPYDGKTYVYLHGLNYDAFDVAKAYEKALTATPLARAFGNQKELDLATQQAKLEIMLGSPWETLTMDLTEGDGPEKIKKYLAGKIHYFDFEAKGFQYRLRRLENKYLLAII